MKRIVILGTVVSLGIVATMSRPIAQGNVAEIEQVKDNLYVITGGGGNTGAFVTDGGVVVVDTKNPEWGAAILDKIKTVTDKKVTMIINTHTHGDHVGSNIDFELPIEFVAHANTKTNMERMPAFQSPSGRQYLPSRTYTDKLSLLGGDDRIDLYYFGQAHTSGDTIVVFPALGVAHTGDMFAWKGVPYIDVNNGGSGVSYPKTLLAAADGIPGVDTVIPGHSPVMTWADFREFGEFNRDFLTAVERGKAEGKTAAQAAANLNLPAKYANYAMSRGTLTSAEDNATKIYAELDQ
ncbi:MAG TPA: MBL fold metallo-hydrolase [Acidobacteria bacterium]|nr:MBL fold metallo-hydrolase [Acidobacteriota bacterium]